MYGSIGYTRRDRTPKHWRDDYRLNATAKKMIQKLKAERERLFREFEALPVETYSDEEYNQLERILRVKLDELIDKEDKIRFSNPR